MTPLPGPSKTVLAPKGKPTGAMKFTKTQMLISQKISQAAVRRSNALMAHIRTGINGSDFSKSAITGVDLAAGTVQP